MKADKVDAVIVGSGASGAVLAKELALAGLQVVVLERGPKLNPEDFKLHDEQISHGYGMTRPAIGGEDPRNPREFRYQGEENFSVLYPHEWGYSAQAAAVGGGQFFYGGLMWRRPPIEFRMKTEYGHLEGTTLEDWPFSFEEIEPYFTKAEYEMGVSGKGGVNPFEGKRSKPFPLPPIDLQPGDKMVRDTATKMGYHPFTVPLGILSRPYRGRNSCMQHPCCNTFVCEIGAKSTPVTALLPDALASGNCTLIPDAMVREITLDAMGRPNGVEYLLEPGKLVVQPARLVILAGSAIETARLMLNSKSRWFPQGVGNGNDWVGRNLMGHISPSVWGIMDEVTNEGFGPGPGIGIDDFYGKNEGFVGGAVFYSRTEMTPVAFTSRRPRGAPRWGLEHKKYQREKFRRYVRLFAPAEDMPQFENRVEVSPTVRDRFGIPVARITHSFHPNDYRIRQFFVDKMTELLQEMGAHDITPNGIGRGGTGYQLGTCRIGNDPKTSVLNSYGQSHEVDNLFVVDASTLVTSGGRNPVLTIQALAYRFAEYIVREWKGGAWREGRREL
ncbi:MAG: GMC family oxidoreductase [Acidobacteriota bacterium]|nr:MAG: GMC family oxidoreductase [Acidobacteriota bacterium]